MVQAPEGGSSGYRQSLWWRPSELARRLVRLDQEAGLQAIGAVSRLGDRLARIEDPADRLVPVVVEHLQAQQQARQARARRWLALARHLDLQA